MTRSGLVGTRVSEAGPAPGPPVVRHRAIGALSIAAFLLGLALLLGILEAAQVYLGITSRGRSITWSDALAGTVPSWLLLAVLVVPIAALTRRYPLVKGRVPRGLAVHGVASVVFAILHLTGTAWIAELRPGQAIGFAERVTRLATIYFVLDLLTYAAVVGVCEIVRRYREDRVRELATARLLANVAEARLLALRGQLQPDFFFNALNSVAALIIKGEGEAGVAALSSLGNLIRRSLISELPRLITVGEELELLTDYLRIQELRYPDRLAVAVDVNPAVRRALVPPLIMQPLVEGAIEQGLKVVRTPVHVVVYFRPEGDRVRVEVRTSGPGFGQDARGVGVFAGLARTRSRLEELFGGDHGFEFGDHPNGGGYVRFTIPYAADRSERPASF